MQITEASPVLVVASPPRLSTPTVALRRRAGRDASALSVAARLDDLAGRMARETGK